MTQLNQFAESAAKPHQALKLALSVLETANATGVGRDKISEAINSGVLPARKLGTRTLILTEDVKIWLSGLPTFCETAHG